MAVGFGFSVSDICMGLKIIKDSIGALNETKGATADYAKLLTEVQSLQDGLAAVQDLQEAGVLSDKQDAALNRAISACQENIQEFLITISKYQPYLRNDASGMVSKFRKVQWALCRKEDIAKFREQVARQASSISMLIITFQATQKLDSTSSSTGQSTIAKVGQSQDTQMIDMLSTMSLEQRQCFTIVMKQNEELMQTVQDMRRMMQLQMSLPSQVMLQQPIVVLDPFGRFAPFHLDFVDSSECFMAVMKARFAHAGVKPAGLAKLDRNEFVLEDTRRRKPVDMTRKWETVWQPGQQYDMRMVFHRFACPPSTCPSCHETNEDDEEQVQCHACGLQYENVQAISARSHEWTSHFPEGATVAIGGEEIPYLLRRPRKEAELKVFQPSPESEDEFFEGYRRVQIVAQSLSLLDLRFPALLLIKDFIHFALLVRGVPDGVSSYKDEILQLEDRAMKYIWDPQNNIPPFSSFAFIEEMKNSVTKVSQLLRRDIDSLVRKLCEDPDTKHMMFCIERNRLRDGENQVTGYYIGVLTRMVALAEKATMRGNSSPKSASREKMEWLLLDSRAT